MQYFRENKDHFIIQVTNMANTDIEINVKWCKTWSLDLVCDLYWGASAVRPLLECCLYFFFKSGAVASLLEGDL